MRMLRYSKEDTRARMTNFLCRCRLGEIFTYADSYELKEIIAAGDRIGVGLLYCGPESSEYKKFGCFTVKVVSLT